MPLVLTQNDATVEGHDYADVLGQSYEYPRIYRNAIVTGERFVYYRGRRTATGAARPQVYLGTGVVGRIDDGANGLLTCAVEDFRPFPTPLPFKDGDAYREPRANAFPSSRTGLFFRTGVRPIDESAFDAIVAAGWGDATEWDPVVPPEVVSHQYASPEDLRAVDDVAMELAQARARTVWPAATVVRMPHNNPGYDLRIVHGSEPDDYVEVKGTRRSAPTFFLSEGERSFAERNAARYHFWVFYGIDLVARTGDVATHVGALTAPDVTLAPKQWVGTLAV